jgi:hypothetical protein
MPLAGTKYDEMDLMLRHEAGHRMKSRFTRETIVGGSDFYEALETRCRYGGSSVKTLPY